MRAVRVWTTVLSATLAATAAPLVGAKPYYVLRLGAKVTPERVATVTAEEAGEVEVCWRGGDRPQKGALLARVNPEALEMERLEMELQVRQGRLEAEAELLQLTRQREEMEFIASLPEGKRFYVAAQAKTGADARALEALERKRALVEERAALQERKLRELFAKKEAVRDLRMPFDGRVQFHVPLPREGERALVAAGAPVLTVADDSALYVAVVMADPALAQLEPERLSVRVATADGGRLEAHWAHRRVEKSGQNEALAYYFRVPEAEGERAWGLLGANVTAELWYEGEEGWRCEEKAALAREAGERPFESWEELAAALRPGWSIVFSGETHLCLRPSPAAEEASGG